MTISPAFELLVSGLVSRSRLLERALHDEGPWIARAYGCCTIETILAREVLSGENRVVFTGYLDEPCSEISAIEIYCRGTLVSCQLITGLAESPCRFTLAIVVAAGELAA